MGPLKRGYGGLATRPGATTAPCPLATTRSPTSPGWGPRRRQGPLRWHHTPLTAPPPYPPTHHHPLRPSSAWLSPQALSCNCPHPQPDTRFSVLPPLRTVRAPISDRTVDGLLGLRRPLCTPHALPTAPMPPLLHQGRAQPPAPPPPCTFPRSPAECSGTRTPSSCCLAATTVIPHLLMAHSCLEHRPLTIKHARPHAPPSRCSTGDPPFFNPHGDMLWFWDAMRQLPPAPTDILCYTRRGHEWFLDCNLPPPDVFVIAPHCPLCGRPERPAAVVHCPSDLTHYPGFFCTSPGPLSVTCRTELADRSSSDVAGVLVPNAILVSLTSGEPSCFSSAVVPVAPPPPPTHQLHVGSWTRLPHLLSQPSCIEAVPRTPWLG